MSVLQVLSSKPLISCQRMRFKRIAKVANVPCEVGLRGGVTESDVLSSGTVVEVKIDRKGEQGIWRERVLGLTVFKDLWELTEMALDFDKSCCNHSPCGVISLVKVGNFSP
ncbi:hypothetical protein Tco_1445823 [Tanacetum coccineum]